MYSLRPDQQQGVEKALSFLQQAKRGDSLLLVSPTGSGKSYLQAELLKRVPGLFLVVPSIEIARGIARKLVDNEHTWTDAEAREETEKLRIYTVVRFKNLLMSDGVELPKFIAFDEAHHTEANTYETVWDSCGKPPRLGFTATAYRGTPEGTKDLLQAWGEPYTVLSLHDAVKNGIIALPDFSVWPLLDDDEISIVNGEFHVKTVDAMVKDKMGDLVDRVSRYFDGTHWDRPMMMSFSSITQVSHAESAFRARGLPVVAVVGDTADRQRHFADVVARTRLLLQIKVVGEGVDLPIRRLIDCAPTMSPVAWMQLVGRITRPTDTPPEYIACCHNLTRHAYLWHGLVPAESVRKAQQAWGEDWKPNRRAMSRALGLEGFGKFAVSDVPLAGGLKGAFYGLQTKDGRDQWAVFVNPVQPQPLYFHKHNEWDGTYETVQKGATEYKRKKMVYGKWKRIQQLPEVTGCVSLPPQPMTPGQANFWKNAADRYNLDSTVKVNARQFQLLPVLRDTGLRVRV